MKKEMEIRKKMAMTEKKTGRRWPNDITFVVDIGRRFGGVVAIDGRETLVGHDLGYSAIPVFRTPVPGMRRLISAFLDMIDEKF